MKSALSGSAAALALLVPLEVWAQGYGQGQAGEGSGPYGGYGSQQQGQYGQQQPPYGQQQNQPNSLQAGGLTAPATETDPESQETEEKLEKAEEEDSGRGLEFFYLNAEFGFEYLDLQTFSEDNLVAGSIETSQVGLLYGGGLGLRLMYVTVGARFRYGDFSAWEIWTLNGEVGLRVPIGNLEPFVTLGAGYASMGSLGVGDSAEVDISGYDIRLGGGLDYYVTPVFSIGAGVTAEMLGLARSGVSASQLMGGGVDSVYAADGSSLGLGITGTLMLGLHF